MRILAIRGENLASLAEPFELDLSRAPLDRAGLFALTGPVGAGKSTLLDAMCLALFDRTPRLSGHGGAPVGAAEEDEREWLAGNDVRTVLRRGASEGWAEVDFAGHEGQRFRARWSVRRARRKIDGRLQAQELSLQDLNTGQLIGSGRKTETLQAIRERLGLSFDQFRRSVMLAQGEFAAFLKARPRERAELLERMTGTEIYRRISLQAFQKFRDESARLRSLEENASGLQPLDEGERGKLEVERQRADSELEMLKVAEGAAMRAWSWHQAAERWRLEEEQARQTLEEARTGFDAAADRFAYLQRVRAAQPLRPRVEALARAENDMQLARAALRRADERLESGRAATARAAEGVAEALSMLCADESWVRENRAGIPLAQDWNRWGSELERLARTVGSVADLEARRADLDERVTSMEREFVVAEERAEQRAVELASARARYDAARAAATAVPRAALQERRRELARNEGRLSELCRLADRAREVVHARDEAQATEARYTTRLEVASKHGINLATEQAAGEKALAVARAELRSLEAALDLASHRTELVDGEACPLCGATEHPHADRDFPAVSDSQRGRVQELETRLRELLAGVVSNLVDQRHLVEQRDMAATQIDTLTADLERIRSSWTSAVDSRMPDDPTSSDTEATLAGMQSAYAGEQAAVHQEELHAEELHRVAAAAEHEYLRSLDEWTESGTGFRTVERNLQELAAAQRSLNAKLESAERTRDELAIGLDQAFMGLPNWRAEVSVDSRAFIRRCAALADRCQAHQDVTEALAAATTEAEAAAVADAAARVAAEERRAELERAAAEAEVSLAVLSDTLLHDAAWIVAEEGELDELRTAVERSRAVLRERGEQRRRHEQTERPDLDADDARQTLEELKTMVGKASDHLAQVRYRLDQDDFTRRALAELQPRIQRQRQALVTWQTLSDLIGSAKGDKFQIFAQSLTMECLLQEANRNLAELARRYRLRRVSGEDLDLLVVDQEMGDTVRSIHTLSGGESFLVSLALALGLASLAAPRTRVETLFIDEGFGTLDGRSLEMALAALDALQATGCQVGVISHVDGLAERIGVSVDVWSDGRGRSRVVVPGRGSRIAVPDPTTP